MIKVQVLIPQKYSISCIGEDRKNITGYLLKKRVHSLKFKMIVF